MPYLLAVNINGTIPTDPDAPIRKRIRTLGSGSEDLRILQLMLDTGYAGPVGLLNHLHGEDSEVVLAQNLAGLRDLLPKLGLDPAELGYED